MLLAMPSGESRNSAKRRLSYSSKSRITSRVQRSPTRSRAPATRRVLERVPGERFDWRPHPRSMSAGQLAQHVASIPGNAARLAKMDGFDVSTAPATYAPAENREKLLAAFEDSVTSLRAFLA